MQHGTPDTPRQEGTAPGAAQGLEPIALPRPGKEEGKSVLAALRERKTIRDISSEELPLQVLSDLLWAANGINRESGPFGALGRTAGSASNSQEIDVYAATPEGIYRYEAAPHRLDPVVAGDHRKMAGNLGQAGQVTRAPVTLIYVADIAKFAQAGFQEPGPWDPEVQRAYYYVDTGLIAGNVYLFAAAKGLAAWFHNCDKPGLAALLNLGPEQRPLFAQTAGYPASEYVGDGVWLNGWA